MTITIEHITTEDTLAFVQRVFVNRRGVAYNVTDGAILDLYQDLEDQIMNDALYIATVLTVNDIEL